MNFEFSILNYIAADLYHVCDGAMKLKTKN